MSDHTPQYRPLTNWPSNKPPTPASERTHGTFRTTLSRTQDQLDDELRRIRARDVVVQVDLSATRLRRDGGMYADARPNTCPAVLTFRNRDGQPVTIACDSFKTFDANLHAIVLTLHDLRRIERYGTAAAGEQYRGWTALPAFTTTAMNAQQAADFLSNHGGGYMASEILAKVDSAKHALRVVRAQLHPDNGGRSGDFALATDAGRVLAAHHGVEKL